MVWLKSGEECKLLPEFGIYNPLLKKEDIQKVKNMKTKIKPAIKLDDGLHEGIIQKIEYRTEPYAYVDVVIKEKESGLDLKVGYPFNVTENSALGNVLMAFGLKIEVDKEIEIEDYINGGLNVKFLTQKKKTEKGEFCNIIPSSLKPKE